MSLSWRAVRLSLLLVLMASMTAEAQTLERYWADLQGDNRTGPSPEEFYVFGRDSVGLDIVALTPHASDLSENKWLGVKAAATALNAPGSFIAFSGYEWNSGTWGHKVVHFLTDDQPLIKPNVLESNHPYEFFALLAQTNGLAHVAHPSLQSVTTNWNYHDPAVQVSAEIYSRWGDYETHPTNGKSVRDAWARGYRLAVFATSDTDSLPGLDGGLTAILAEELTREAIDNALRARRTYATTGARIELDFKVNDAIIGEVVNDVIGDAAVHAHVEGTAPVSRIEIRSNNDLVYIYAPPARRTFVDVGGALSYFPGTIEPPASWKEFSFNDAGWLPGRSGIGFGDDDDVTTITGMKDKYFTLYTRQTFSVTDNAPRYLYLGVDYDDGFIAYIDGVEVLRVNMPEGPVTFDTPAGPFREPNLGAKAVVGATQPPFYTDNGLPTGTPMDPVLDLYNLTDYAWMLTPGTHVLAIEVHNSLLSSGDLTMIPRLYEPDPATTATVNFTDAGASGDRFYDVKVIQLDGEMAWSSPIWLNPDAPPRPIATVFDTPGDHGSALDISWTKSEAADFGHYDIFVSEFEFTDASGMARWNATPIYDADSLRATIDSFDGKPLERGKTYFVYVGAFDQAGKMNGTTFGALASGAPLDNIAPLAPAYTLVTDTPDDDGGSLRVQWAPSPDEGAGANDVEHYEIFRRVSTSSYGTKPLAVRNAGTTSYQDNTTDDTKTYFYRVRAHDGVNPSEYTLEFGPIASIDNGGISEPQNVIATDVPGDQGGAIEIRWDLIAEDRAITQYLIYRTTAPGFYGSPLATLPNGTSSFIDSTVANATDYFYAIVSDSAGVRQSTWSEEVGPVQAIDNIPPDRIAVLDAVDNFKGGSVDISWSYDEAAYPDLDHYDIYYKNKSFSGVTTISPILSVAKGDSFATVNELGNNVGYYFTVVPVDEAGNFYATSLKTNWAKPTDNTPPTFSGLEQAIPGDASITVGWTPARDNSLPLEYSLFMATSPDQLDYSTPDYIVPGTTPIVPLGAPWRYFKGITAPPAAWNQKIYDASGWLMGEGAFGYDTHTTPIYETATTFMDMDGYYASVFFRHDFELAVIPKNLILGVLVDDGYIAYINGIEVSRYNLDDPVSHNSLAEKGINAPWNATLDLSAPSNYNPEPQLKHIDLNDYIGLLNVGRNTLAFQVHNRKRANPDFLFLAELASANSDFTITGLDESKDYYFTLRATDGAGNREFNNTIVSARPFAAPAPAGVGNIGVSKSGSSLKITWSPVTTDSLGASITPAHYNVYRDTQPDFAPDREGHSNLMASVTGTSWKDATALSIASDLYYRVTAVSTSGRESAALSPLGMKTRRTLSHVPGAANIHWITVPYLSGIPDAQTLLIDLNGGPFPGPVVNIERFDALAQRRQILEFDNGAWVGENFPLAAGEAYAIKLQSNLQLTLVGAHNPNLGFTFPHRMEVSNFYTLGLPYHSDYIDARNLLMDLNNGNEPTGITKIVRMDPATGNLESYLYFAGQWLGENFAITPGQGYAIIVRSDISGWKPRVR